MLCLFFLVGVLVSSVLVRLFLGVSRCCIMKLYVFLVICWFSGLLVSCY